MIRVEIDECIRRPIDQVFERLVDIDSYAAWMPTNGLLITSTKDSAGPVSAGTAYSDTTRLGTVRGEVSRFEPPNAVVFHYTARVFGMTAMEGWPGYALERLDVDRTALHHHARARLYGPFQLLQPLVQLIARWERQRTVSALKASLESSTVPHFSSTKRGR
jgi:uncharacterized protein YndB with AHSA1/START domain